ncbi:hypothetical protein J437_LFUL014759 [Ladona fulva]|uniref:GH18 domain-containing protein n=1 Tax=Ladona fulva TaxID=123851 RepID=A0A8K0KIW6_LADFU|nr:hypothetical protein J437_LFUL014759 [Ladona fulva]
MKIFTLVAIVQVFLLASEARSDAIVENKRVTCFYLTPMTELNGTLDIEDIDASICTHLLVDETAINQAIEEHYDGYSSGVGMNQEFEKLKAVNPNLKLIVQVRYSLLSWIGNFFYSNGTLDGTSEGASNATQGTIRLLKKMGFDGVDFNIDYYSAEKLDEMADMFCDMKNEFDKNGYIITIDFAYKEGSNITQARHMSYNFSKLTRCCDHLNVLYLGHPNNVTQRMSSLRMMKSTVDKYIERGLPPNKIVITIPAFGNIYALEDPQDTGMGAKIDVERSPQIGDSFIRGFIFHRDLVREMNNSSLAWTIRRDEETKEPYAFTKTGLWASYDDRTSIEVKANYVLEKGLGGILIFPINLEDKEGIGGEGTFPLTRAVFNSLRGLQTEEKTS